jgi:hypothetical protein
MSPFLLRADDLLHGGPWATQSARPGRVLLQLSGFVVVFGLLYGAVMGTFAGVSGQRLLQVLYSALKVPLLLLVTFALSLPSFFVLNTLAGLRDDFVHALRALVATQAGLTIILASLAPFTALWYASNADYQSAILFNALMFGIASLAAQWLLNRFYRPLIERNARHRWLLRLWLIVYAFVGMQMGWLLRPFIGDPSAPTRFFRQHMWGNAYEMLAKMIWNVLRH